MSRARLGIMTMLAATAGVYADPHPDRRYWSDVVRPGRRVLRPVERRPHLKDYAPSRRREMRAERAARKRRRGWA